MGPYLKSIRSCLGSRCILLPGVRALILNHRDEILLQHRNDVEQWGLPAGSVELNETALEALRREVREETDLEIRSAEPMALYSGPSQRFRYPNGDEIQGFAMAFLIRDWTGTPSADGIEGSDVRFWPMDALPSMVEIHARTIEDFKRYQGKLLLPTGIHEQDAPAASCTRPQAHKGSDKSSLHADPRAAMAERQFLEQLTDSRWTGIRFLEHSSPDAKPCARLCDAVRLSFRENLTVPCETVECLGALRSLGLGHHDQLMAQQVSEKNGMPPQRAQELLNATPVLRGKVRAVELGTVDQPDVFMAYLKPEAAMHLLRRWQRGTGQRLATELSAFTAVCASLVAAYQEGPVIFSFGCPDSRRFGGIEADRLVAALARGAVRRMMQESETHANV